MVTNNSIYKQATYGVEGEQKNSIGRTTLRGNGEGLKKKKGRNEKPTLNTISFTHRGLHFKIY